MKIVLTTTFLVALLAVGVFGISNNNSGDSSNSLAAYAMKHAGEDTSKPMNATLAFAMNHEGNETKPMGNDTSMR